MIAVSKMEFDQGKENTIILIKKVIRVKVKEFKVEV